MSVAVSGYSSDLSYLEGLCSAMALCAMRPNALFLGQGVAVKGTTMSQTFRDVPLAQRLEMPVAEDMQMGMAVGMALNGFLPICVFPRWNFLICASNQIINHLDRLPLYSDGGYQPKVIIRTAVPSREPFYPGEQHDDDFTEPFRFMLRTVHVQAIKHPCEVVERYREALDRKGSTLLVEYTELYKDARKDEK